METETVESTTTTTREIEETPKGVISTETTTSSYDVPTPHHCDCPECQEWEEDVAHEIAVLRDRLNLMTESGAGKSEGETKASPEPKEKETVVEATPEVKAESKDDPPKADKPKRKAAGWFI